MSAAVARYCIACGHCLAACPEDAITVEGFEGVATPLLPSRPPVTPEAMMALLCDRRSGREYRPEPVRREHLDAMMQAASSAPSALNSRPVRAYVLSDSAALAGVRDAVQCHYRRLLRLAALPGFTLIWRVQGHSAAQFEMLRHSLRGITTAGDQSDPLLHGAPALLAFTTARGAVHAQGDAWLAAHNAVLYAETIPVATCYNGYTAIAANGSGAVRRALGVPRGEEVVAVLTLGYPKRRHLRRPPRRPIETEGVT